MPYQREETDPTAIASWLELFLDSHGALMEPADDPADASAVVLRQIGPGRELLMDVGAVPFTRSAVDARRRVVLSRFCGDDHVCSSPVSILQLWQEKGCELALVEFPACLLITRRRHEFRAPLRRDLRCDVALSVGSLREPLHGELMNLSMSGCQVRFSLDAIHVPEESLGACGLTLSFPNGDHIALECTVRHFDPIVERGQIICGFEFLDVNDVRERVLWHSVCEIEREAARGAGAGRKLLPSRLFVAGEGAGSVPARTAAGEAAQHATTMARQLNDLGNGTGVLLHDLRSRGLFEPSALSRLADRLLALHEGDRQELLFALVCLGEQPPLVRHCLGVAVRLTDVARQLAMPRQRVKTVAACALVHDLALALDHGADVDPCRNPQASPEALATVRAALKRCGWLPVSMVDEIVVQVNERLDGSGYPRGLSGTQIGHLARVAAVIDVIDQRSRSGRDEGLMSFAALRQWLLEHDGCFARRWVDYCFSLFGPIPVGARVSTQTGERFWLRRLHDDGSCAALVPCRSDACPSPGALHMELTGAAVIALGPLAEVTAAT